MTYIRYGTGLSYRHEDLAAPRPRSATAPCARLLELVDLVGELRQQNRTQLETIETLQQELRTARSAESAAWQAVLRRNLELRNRIGEQLAERRELQHCRNELRASLDRTLEALADRTEQLCLYADALRAAQSEIDRQRLELKRLRRCSFSYPNDRKELHHACTPAALADHLPSCAGG